MYFVRRGVKMPTEDIEKSEVYDACWLDEARRFCRPRSERHILGMIGRESGGSGYRLVQLEGGEPAKSGEGEVPEVTMVRHVAWWDIGYDPGEFCLTHQDRSPTALITTLQMFGLAASGPAA